jgi:O-antigen/teichoic acid export membrane protein
MTNLRRRLDARVVLRSSLAHVRDPLYLNAYALMASNVVSSGLGLIYWGLAARFYAPSAVGEASAVISTSLFVTAVSQLNLRVALMRLVPEAGKQTGRLVLTAYATSSFTTAIVASACVLAIPVLFPNSALIGALGPIGALGFVVGTVSWTIFNLQDGVLTGLRRALWVPVENASYGIAKIILLVIFVTWAPVLGVVGSWFIPMALVVVGVSMVLFRWIPQHAHATGERSFAMDRRRLLGFIAGDYLASLISVGITTLLPVLITVTLGPRDGAFFYVVWIIGTSLNLLPIYTCASMTVEALHGSADVHTAVRRVSLHLARILVPVALVTAVASPLILSVFGPDYATNGTDALRVIALSVVPFGVNVMTMAIARIRGRASEIILVQAALAVSTLALTVVLLQPMGVTGVAIAWLLAQLGVAAVLGPLRILPIVRAMPQSPRDPGQAPTLEGLEAARKDPEDRVDPEPTGVDLR